MKRKIELWKKNIKQKPLVGLVYKLKQTKIIELLLQKSAESKGIVTTEY